MTSVPPFELRRGRLPLLISVPHAGRRLPAEIESAMTPLARTLPDTDWHVDRLYGFATEMGVSILVANYSRYVVDLNRSAEDESLYPGRFTTGLCPTETFAGTPVYEQAPSIGGAERRSRIESFWRPYHRAIRRELSRLRDEHGYALLWDAHSIASRVPRLFDGTLPTLNIGTNDGRSCPRIIERAVAAAAEHSTFDTVVNDRFKGGYITRHYGAPERGCYAIQLELAQRSYMSEHSLRYDPERAAVLVETLRRMLQEFLDSAAALRSES